VRWVFGNPLVLVAVAVLAAVGWTQLKGRQDGSDRIRQQHAAIATLVEQHDEWCKDRHCSFRANALP
jgi:hypothetical protein